MYWEISSDFSPFAEILVLSWSHICDLPSCVVSGTQGSRSLKAALREGDFYMVLKIVSMDFRPRLDCLQDRERSGRFGGSNGLLLVGMNRIAYHTLSLPATYGTDPICPRYGLKKSTAFSRRKKDQRFPIHLLTLYNFRCHKFGELSVSVGPNWLCVPIFLTVGILHYATEFAWSSSYQAIPWESFPVHTLY